MSYDLYDFTESMSIAGIEAPRVTHCSFAFGESPEGYGSWHGGFVCHTRSGAPWIFVFGWCDTTGWGCQDGAWVHQFNHEPTLDELEAAWSTQMSTSYWSEAIASADIDPIDINRYLAGEINRWGAAVDKGQ